MRTVIHTRESLIAFELKVADAFLAKRIHAPIHLCSPSQADYLINVFQNVSDEDWVCATYRSHFHALLKGVPEAVLFDAILDGRSMFFQSKEHRFLSSAIVGGHLPIALGIAMGIKRKGGRERVHVFLGEMAERTGIFHEFSEYCRGHELPVRVVVENNGYSTNTPTEEVWGPGNLLWRERFQYERTYPHCGLDQFVSF